MTSAKSDIERFFAVEFGHKSGNLRIGYKLVRTERSQTNLDRGLIVPRIDDQNLLCQMPMQAKIVV